MRDPILLTLVALVAQCLAQNCTSCATENWCIEEEICVTDCSACNSTNDLLCGPAGAANATICETDLCFESTVCTACDSNSGCKWQGVFCASENVATEQECSFGECSFTSTATSFNQARINEFCQAFATQNDLNTQICDDGAFVLVPTGKRQSSSSSGDIRVYDSTWGSGDSIARSVVDDVNNNPDAYRSFGFTSFELAGGGDGSSSDDDLSAGAIAGIVLASLAVVVLCVVCVVLIVGIIAIIIIFGIVGYMGSSDDDTTHDYWASSGESEMSERGKESDSESESSSAESDSGESESTSSSEANSSSEADSSSKADSSSASTSNGKADSSSGNSSSVSGSSESDSDESSDESS